MTHKDVTVVLGSFRNMKKLQSLIPKDARTFLGTEQEKTPFKKCGPEGKYKFDFYVRYFL